MVIEWVIGRGNKIMESISLSGSAMSQSSRMHKCVAFSFQRKKVMHIGNADDTRMGLYT